MSLFGQTFIEEGQNDPNKTKLFGQTFNPNFSESDQSSQKTASVNPVLLSLIHTRAPVESTENVSLGPRIGLKPQTQESANNNAVIIQHNPSLLERIEDFASGIGKAFKSGGENSPIVTGLTKLALGKQYNATPTPTPYVPQNLAERISSGAGEQAAEWPLWMIGGGISKGVLGATKLAPVISKLPGAIKTGINAGLTYGGAVAPAETALQGDGLQGLVEREKQVPLMAAGGVALHGAGQLIGKGISKAGSAITDRKISNLINPVETNPLEDLQNAYRSPSLRDVQTANPITRSVQRKADLGPLKLSETLTPKYKARQAELNSVFQNQPLAEQPISPIVKTTLQQNIDNSLGIGRQGEAYQGLDAFKPIKTYNLSTGEQKAFDALQDGIKTAQEFQGSNKLINDFAGESFTNEAAFDNIKHYTGVDLPQLIANWEKAQIATKSLTPEQLRLGRVSGAIPQLKAREPITTPTIEPLPTQPKRIMLSGNLPIDTPLARPVKQLQPVVKESLTWTNREGIPTSPTPNRPIPEQQTLADVSELNPKLDAPTPIPKDTKIFWQSVNKELHSVGERPPLTTELMKKDIADGKIDISKLSNEEEIRSILGMDLQKFSTLPEPQSKIIIGKPKERMSFKDALNKFYTATVNTQQPIVNAAKVAESDMGKLASNTKNVSGIVDYNLLNGLVDKEGNKVGESLKSTIEAIPKGKEEDFWTYMSQRHNIDRAREEFKMVAKTDKQGFIVKDKDGNPIMRKEVTKKPTPVQANYTPKMSAEAVKQIEQVHPEYKVIGDGITQWLDKFMQTWGVDTGIVNKDIYKSLRETYKSYIPTQREFSELEKAIPDNVSQKFADQRTPLRKATGSERDITDPTENIMNLVNRTIRAAKYNEVGQSLLESVRTSPEKMKQFAEVIPTKEGMFANTDNIITVLEDGKPTYLKINNKMLLDSMNGLPKAIGRIPVLDDITNVFKSLITQKNPFFALRNVFRDVPTAYVYGSTANPLKFGAGLVGAGKDILTNSPRLQKYQAVGGGGANFFSSGDVTKSAAEIMDKGSKIKKIVTTPIKGIEKLNNMLETAPRLAEFNRVLNKTGDVTKALYAAGEVTVNFARSGNVTKAADKAVPYLNAGVQGLDRFFRGFISPKAAIQTIAKSGVAITTPTLVFYVVNKDNPNYQKLDNRTKDTYFLVPKPDGTFFPILKSRELGVLFSSLLERGLRQSEGQKESFKGFGNTVKTNFSPANPFDSNFLSPVYNAFYTNKDFADRPIVPQAMLMDKRSDYLQYDEKTTSIAKAIGELTKGMPGNPDGLSPKILDYLVKSYTGVIGQFGIPLAAPGGTPTKALKSQFGKDPLFSNQVTTDFYDKLDKLSATATDKNIIQKITSKKLTPEEDMRNSMSGINSALTRGTKLINSIQASNDTAKEDKIKAIKVKQLELSKRGVLADTPKLMQKVENDSKKLFVTK
ncbi:MAG: LPD38 domain-containing protein [Phycisphaerae bacterium]|jgi:hypothetical protein